MEKVDDNEELYDISTYQTFLNSIRHYPIGTAESNLENFLKYRETGDKKYYDALFTSNLHYVIKIANRYSKKLNSMDIMDVINNGILGLSKAIEQYNPEMGAFLTYATSWIKQAIFTKMYSTDDIIRKPSYLKILVKKYLDLIEKNESISDEDLCESLKISPVTLNTIRESLKTKPSSLDIPVGDDKVTGVGDFVADKKDDYLECINKYDDDNLKKVLRHVLSDIQYYVIYYRFLSEEKKTLEEIASSFAITRERVRQIEAKALVVIKRYLNYDSHLFRDTLASLKEQGVFDYIEIEPLSPNKIITYLYIKDSLSTEERKIYEQLVYGKYQAKKSILVKELKELKLNLATVDSLVASINLKKKEKLKDKKSFEEFRQRIIDLQGIRLLSKSIISEVHRIDYNYLNEKYAGLSLDEILSLFEKVEYSLLDNERKLLECFFGKPEKYLATSYDVEKEINVLLFGYRPKSSHPPLNKLYKEYLRIKDTFTFDQQLYLECFLFGKKSHKEFFAQYANGLQIHEYDRVVKRLERNYYRIFDYFDKAFTKEMWEAVRSKYQDRFTPFKLKVLDMEYGIDGRCYTRDEMAAYFGIDKEKLSHDMRAIIKYANNLYIGLSSRIDIDKEKYLPYILDDKYEFTKEIRMVLTYFIKDNKTYEEICELTGFDKDHVSNVITSGVRRIDYYRFGMFKPLEITYDEINDYFKAHPKLSEVDKQIILLKYFNHLENVEISSKVKIDLRKVNIVIGTFNSSYFRHQVKDVQIENADLIHQVSLHISESVLTEKERAIVSFLLGICNQYNPQGKILTKEQIPQELSITPVSLKNSLIRLTNNVKGYKTGILKADNLFIERDKLNVLLDDVHLPISDKERDIICYLFELKGFPYKTYDELEKVFGENVGSIRVRYQRAIALIYRYINNEIDGKIDYETDLLPLLKYFGTSDREKINDYYRDGLSYDAMSKKYQTTMGKITGTMQRINSYVYELQHNPYAKIFDFDYYLEVIDNPDLPFYGDLDVAKKIFDLMFGMNGNERLSAPETVKALGLNIDPSTANRVIANLMLAVCKLRDGITKEKSFSREEVMEYYEKNKDLLTKSHRVFYENYFRKVLDEKRINETKRNLSTVIISDLIKEKYANTFIMENATREEILNLLHRFRNDIIRSVREELMNKFAITEREFMTGRELNHLYKLLFKLDISLRNQENGIAFRKAIN